MSIGYLPEFRCRPEIIENQTRFRVWAPFKSSVELVLIETEGSQSAHVMQAGEWGYFDLTVPHLKDGSLYAYRLDNGPLRPDPCSLWQPDGVHLASAIYDASSFSWTDENWQPIAQNDLVFYELHVGTFTDEGTFDAIIPRLESLKELGITAIELLPVAQFPGDRNWGYDGVHPFAAQNSYGGPAGLQRLIDAAHQIGLSVILDVVYNHLGPEGNYLGEFGAYFSGTYSTAWGQALNYDGPHSDPVRQYFLENVWHWIHDFHLDGLRLDAVHSIYDNSPVHLLTEIKQVADAAAKARGSEAIIIAESLLNDIRMIRPPEQGGYGLDAEWNEDFHHAVQAFMTEEHTGKYADFGEVKHLKTIFEENFSLSGQFSQFRQRRWGASAAGFAGSRFVAGIQNHDHIGNRAQGERFSQLLAPAEYRLAACLSLLSPFLPLIFMGEEYGETNPFPFFCSFQDLKLIRNVRKGRKRDFGFGRNVLDPQKESTYEMAKLQWNWPEGSEQAGYRQMYHDLLQARRTWPAIKNPLTRTACLRPDQENTTLLEWKYESESQTLVCLFNLTDQMQTIEFNERAILFRSEVQLYTATTDIEPLSTEKLRPFECAVMSSIP